PQAAGTPGFTSAEPVLFALSQGRTFLAQRAYYGLVAGREYMFCTSWGREMASEDAFCPKCGTASGAAPTARAAAGPQQRLSRSVRNKKVAGVCGGFANYFGMDVTLVRVLWLITVLCVGTGI